MQSHYTIYVVDDDEIHNQSLTRLLIENGYQTRSYLSVDEFLKQTNLIANSILLLDMRMPEKNGIALQKELLERKISLPIIFLSGQSFPNEIVESFRKGAFNFFFKPFDCDELLKAITDAIVYDQMQKESINHTINQKILYERLSEREKEIFKLLCEGLLSKEIAFQLSITPRTVKAHKANIMTKMNATRIQDLVKISFEINK
ncbi:MAG: DNA-binding response regulator [Burkholderiaceae bacterium]|nr:DNA-binding response regulator [Burkholderiaceae bacterium]